MSLSSIQQVYAFEGTLENAIELTLRQTYGVGFATATRRETTKLSTPFVTILCTAGAGDNSVRYVRGGTTLTAAYSATVDITINSFRTTGEMNHQQLIGCARACMQNWRIINNNLTYYRVESVEETGTSHSVQQENNIDETTLSFNVTLLILNTAWPTTL